jgi:hypothetical protein
MSDFPDYEKMVNEAIRLASSSACNAMADFFTGAAVALHTPDNSRTHLFAEAQRWRDAAKAKTDRSLRANADFVPRPHPAT